MKRVLSLTLIMNCFMACEAQTIQNPSFDRSDVPSFHITKVDITKDTTYVFCSYYGEGGSWANISPNTCLRDSKSRKSYPLYRCEGLPYSPQVRHFYQNESCELLFCFPSIAGIEQFDFIEIEGERGFNIYGVSLKRKYKTSYTDAELELLSEMLSTYDPSVNAEKKTQLKDYSTSLYNLETYNASIGNYPEAIRLGKAELGIIEIIFGKEDPGYTETLDRLVKYCASTGDYNEAIRLGIEEVRLSKSVFGAEDSNYVNSIENLVTYYKEIGDLDETVRLQKEVTNIKKNIYGIDHKEYAYSLANLAYFNYVIGNYEEAIQQGTEAVGIWKEIVGTDDPDYAISLGNLGLCYYEIGNFKEALRLEMEAMNIYKKDKGAEYPYYATSLSRLADYNKELLNLDEAIKLCTETMKIYKRVLGTEHPYYVRSLGSLADYYSIKGNYNEAIRLGIETMNIYKKVYKTDNGEYASLLSNLAGYYQELGNYSATFGLMTEAMEIYERVFGKESLNYAISLNNLANFNSKVGNYSEAIRLGIEAMELHKKVIGTEHKLYVTVLTNLGNYYSHVGNYSEAIRFGKEAVEICKRVLGLEHPLYAMSLHNLAFHYSDVGDYHVAVRLGTEAMEIYKRVLGTNHPDYARSLNSLAVFNLELGNNSEAIRLGTESMEIRKRLLGSEHLYYATSLLNNAGYYAVCGQYDEAIRLGTEAMEIFKKNIGIEHPYYTALLCHLARYYVELDDYYKAYNFLLFGLRNSQSFVLKNFSELSSRLQDNMWTYKYAYRFNSLLPYIVTKYQTKQSISELYDKTCLFAKGVLLNTEIELRKLILESGDSVIIEKYNVLSSNIDLYNKLLEKPIKERFMNADSLNRVIEQEEMELARESKAFGDYTHNLTISWKDVQSKLSENDIAVEFINFPILKTDSTLYVALTLKKDYDSPHMVTLFEGNQLKAMPEKVYYTQTDLSDIIWKPLEEELKGVNNIYFAPSGELHRIGIEYLPINDTVKVCDVYKLHRMSSTRQLVVIQDDVKGKHNILYGGIDYDKKTIKIVTDSSYIKESVYRNAVAYRANVDSLSLRNTFDYLEGTKKEADMIAEDMEQHRVPYIYYSGTDGTEESFKKLGGMRPNVIHIATHGFYFTEEEAEKSLFTRHEMELLTDLQAGKNVEQKPMTRSGLLFSGCNRTVRHEEVPDEEEDGILTAQEISTLDLRGLDLVVLSACQTGLGDIISGEGVFGLQRGFKKAGARTIIMSLWNVNDDSTMKMMTSFYHHYLDGMSKEEAFHAAQNELRKNIPTQQERPDWAAFIMLDGIN